MQKFLFACVCFVAVACIAANYANAPPAIYGAPPAIYGAPPVAYVEIPLPQAPAYAAPSHGYGAPAHGYGPRSYAAPAPAPAVLYKTVPLPPLTYGGPKRTLSAAPNNPRATAAAASSSVGLKPGSYKNVVVPSYAIVSGVPGPELGAYGSSSARGAGIYGPPRTY